MSSSEKPSIQTTFQDELREVINIRRIREVSAEQMGAELNWSARTCPVCKSDLPQRLFEDYNRREELQIRSGYVECQGCGMIYLSPVPDWNQFSKYYEWLHSAGSAERACARNTSLGDRRGLLVSCIRSMRRLRFRPHSWPADAGHGRVLLDVGCGDAAKLIEFARRGWRVVGVDISRSALEQARRNLPSGEFLLGELGELSLPKRSFRVVRMDNVLEHVPKPFELAAQCAQLLIPGEGRLIILVPHGRSLSMRLLGRYSNNSWIPFHLSLFTRPALRRLLLEAGFKQVDILTYSPIHALPSSLRQALGRAADGRGWGRLRWPLYLALFPVGWVADRLNMGEELVAVARA